MPAPKRAKAPAKKRPPAKRKPAKRKTPAGTDLVALSGGREAWDRAEGESPEAFQAFALYRDLGVDGRSTARVARELGKTKQLTDRWSGKHRWVVRAAAWDDHQDQLAQEELKRMGVQARMRHANVLHGTMQGLSAPAAELLRRLGEKPELLQALADRDLIAVVAMAGRTLPRLVVAERLTLGIGVGEDAEGQDLTPEQRKVARMNDEEVLELLAGAGIADLGTERKKRRAG